MKTQKIILFAILVLVLGACKKDENEVETPQPSNEEELITTIALHFTEVGNSNNQFMASFKDIDGVGGNDATIDTIKLDTHTVYEVSIELLDESGSVVEDITTEVKEESDEHLFCFDPNTTNLSVLITDSDGTYPIGLESSWETTNSIVSSITVVLKHQPDGQKDGTCSPGETDVEVAFPLVIE